MTFIHILIENFELIQNLFRGTSTTKLFALQNKKLG
jgi:hypothetical protein